jgi:Cu-processing system permease protein
MTALDASSGTTPLLLRLAGAARPGLSPRTVAAFARKELRDSLRNRWFMLYTGAFTVLALSLSFVSMGGTGMEGFAGFGRTAASMINLVILIIPLMALTAGASSLVAERERGVLAYVLTHPVSRAELLAGKFLGLAAAMFASIALGFGVSALAIALGGGGTRAEAFVWMVLVAFVLALAMLSVGLLISACARRQGVAMGVALAAWLAFVFLGDLGLMGGALVLGLRAQDMFHLSLVNPLQTFKIASLGAIHASLDVLGPAGAYATQRYGGSLGWLLAAALAVWTAVPLGLAMLVFSRRDAT